MRVTLDISRTQILSFRRATGCLEKRLPAGSKSFRQAAWAGLQDSMPRAALLSLHARVEGCRSSDWEHSSLVQTWGPRNNVYAVAASDVGVFTLGRLSTAPMARIRSENTAAQLRAILASRSMPFAQVGRLLGVAHNSLRYAAPTGTVLLRWDGARQPTIWCCSAPKIEHPQARLELARRYLHIFGPTTPASFSRWAGVRDVEALDVFRHLDSELLMVKTPLGERWILASDESLLRARPGVTEAIRLLPSGDAFFLAWDEDRALLVQDSAQRGALWTTRVWPGALLMRGEIAGTWRRSAQVVSITAWRRLSRTERELVEAEAQSLPLTPTASSVAVRWD